MIIFISFVVVLFILLCIFLLLLFGYSKKAILPQECYSNGINTISCKSTDNYLYNILEYDLDGNVNIINNVFLEKNTPDSKLKDNFFGFGSGGNSFLLEGRFIGEKFDDYSGCTFRIFEVDDWEIVAPINRGDSLTAIFDFTGLTRDKLYFFDFK